MSQLPGFSNYQQGFSAFNIPGLRRQGKAQRGQIKMSMIRQGMGTSSTLQGVLGQHKQREDERARYMQHLLKRKKGQWKGLLASMGGSILGGLASGFGGSLAEGGLGDMFGNAFGSGKGKLAVKDIFQGVSPKMVWGKF